MVIEEKVKSEEEEVKHSGNSSLCVPVVLFNHSNAWLMTVKLTKASGATDVLFIRPNCRTVAANFNRPSEENARQPKCSDFYDLPKSPFKCDFFQHQVLGSIH